MPLTLDLTEPELEQLRQRATDLCLSPEQFARAMIVDALARPIDAFESAATRTLDENAELYRRLAARG